MTSVNRLRGPAAVCSVFALAVVACGGTETPAPKREAAPVSCEASGTCEPVIRLPPIKGDDPSNSACGQVNGFCVYREAGSPDDADPTPDAVADAGADVAKGRDASGDGDALDSGVLERKDATIKEVGLGD
ncbi:MAG TPA: hypothetical protein VJT73_14430 [Polyangiaceae bacterium]|nr:hypothetical protein [Polyangiaceae bacterium]